MASLAAGVFVLQRLKITAPYSDLLLYSIALFLCIAIFVSLIGPIVAKHQKRQLFLSVMVYNMLLKIILSVVLLLWYKHDSLPENGYFIIPFLYVYFVFSIFETWFLMKVSYLSPRNNP